MADDFSIRRYTDNDHAEVLDFIRVAVSEQYARHLDRIWDWKYDSHPLNREAEQARAKLAAGEPLRLHHVVELPTREGTQALGSLRRISPAVGRAERRP